MTIEANRRKTESRHNGGHTINAHVEELLPGISANSYLGDTELEIGVKTENLHPINYIRFKRLFDERDISLLILSLSDRNPPVRDLRSTNSSDANLSVAREQYKPKRIDFYSVKEEDREKFKNEWEKIYSLKGDLLEETAGDLFSLELARNDFLISASNGRDYKKLYETRAEDGYVAGFMGEMASLMKRHPELWRTKKTNTYRVSDLTAISRYAQISGAARSIIHSEYLESFSDTEQVDIISNHMKLIYGTKPLVTDEGVVGYLNSPGEIFKKDSSSWGIIKNGGPVVIDYQDGKFSIDGLANVLVGEVSWKKNGVRSLTSRNGEERVVNQKSRQNPAIEIKYRLSDENVSELLGLMVIDRIYNVRNRLQGKYGDASRIPEDVYARRSGIINSELIRSAEALLGA